MIRLQDRDIQILTDIGVCQIMSYSQIKDLHFPSYDSCVKRLGALQRYKLVHGAFYNTNEKVFILTKEGNKVLMDLTGMEYKIGNYENIYHKLMRTMFYSSVKKLGINNWINEALIEDIKRVFDVSFEYKDSLYLVEVHNEQKSKALKEKLVDSLNLDIPFTLIVYCKNKNVVRNLIEKMDDKGFSTHRKYKLLVFQTGDEVSL